MNHLIRTFLLAILLVSFQAVYSQQYRYTANLNNLSTDKLHVELLTPAVKKSTIIFSMPKIIPGTYSISDYGRFISNVKAVGKSGPLAVKKLNDNQWQISNATQLTKITYDVDDIYDAEMKHGIYPMAATNFEKDNIVLNTPGVFGFLEGMQQLPFEVTFEKPAAFYASTSLRAQSSTPSKDVFLVRNVDELYDHPIMYNVPDTTTVKVGNTDVIVSVYSPNKQLKSKEIAGWMKELLFGAYNYLGGKLPADKYAFIYYFRAPDVKHSFPAGLGGALEHSTSSFYYVGEAKPEQLKGLLVDISSHEFFHIITPLTIASKEVKQFNFNEAVLSKHLWLYEGVTEYTSHHVQVKSGLNSAAEFLNKLSGKITNSRQQYNDSLSFTEMSRQSAGKYEKEYGNVYEKGALIGMCLDIYLLDLSNGNYGLKNLTHDLGIKYGRNQAFEDDKLFDIIAELSYPEIKQFLVKYVEGSTPIPYGEYFSMAGVQFTPEAKTSSYSFGNIAMVPDTRGVITIRSPYTPNEFGTKMGYKAGDEIYAMNGKSINAGNLNEMINSVKQSMKEGETFSVKVGRKNASNTIDTITLSAPVSKVVTIQKNQLVKMKNLNERQKIVQHAWLDPKNVETPTSPANPADVSTIDAIIKASYDVITGPAGQRNWERHHSLFTADAKMGASSSNPAGEVTFQAFTPAEYAKMNDPFFKQGGFYENELGRVVSQYGNIAQVQSAYQFRFTPDGPVAQRGVNYFTLVKSDGRWWIRSIVWQPETKDNPIPASLVQVK